MFNRFHFRGFQPTAALKAETEELLNRLKAGGPSDAAFLGSVESLPAGYLARLDLFSASFSGRGPLLADASSQDPRDAIQGVTHAIAVQLDKWKKEQEALPETDRVLS